MQQESYVITHQFDSFCRQSLASTCTCKSDSENLPYMSLRACTWQICSTWGL